MSPRPPEPPATRPPLVAGDGAALFPVSAARPGAPEPVSEAGGAPGPLWGGQQITIFNGKHEPGDEYPPTVAEVSDERAVFALHRELFDLSVVARFSVDGEPVSKARARFTKQGYKTQAYTPEKTTEAEQVVAWKFRAAARGHKLDPDIAYGVIAIFFCGTRQRRDVDNMLKLILDGLNGVAWPDDSQVCEVSARKMLTSREDARTEVAVYVVGPVQRVMFTCRQCGKKSPTYPSWAESRQFCSRACAVAWRQVRRTQECEQCGGTFIRTSSNVQKFCSVACKQAAERMKVTCTQCDCEFTKARSHVKDKNFCSSKCQSAYAREHGLRTPGGGTCETCGGPTSKKTYRDCNACCLARRRAAGNPKVLT